MLMEVTCRCGWSTRGTKTEVITRVQEHGRTAHQQDITAAQVREIWRAVEVDGAKK
jgi:predicted small metal-binding protein